MRAAALGAVMVFVRPGVASAADESVDRARCRASYEQAQTLLRDERLQPARVQLSICKETCPTALAKDCLKWSADVDSLMPTVRIVARDPQGRLLQDVRTTVDGLPSQGTLGAPQGLAPGEHTFRFERRGCTPVEMRVELHAGEREHPVTAVLSPVPAPAMHDAAPSRTPSLVVGGIGVALLATGGALALKGHLDRGTLQSSCAPFCSQEAIDSVRTTWWVAGGLAAGGAVALGVAALLWPKSVRMERPLSFNLP